MGFLFDLGLAITRRKLLCPWVCLLQNEGSKQSGRNKRTPSKSCDHGRLLYPWINCCWPQREVFRSCLGTLPAELNSMISEKGQVQTNSLMSVCVRLWPRLGPLLCVRSWPRTLSFQGVSGLGSHYASIRWERCFVKYLSAFDRTNT